MKPDNEWFLPATSAMLGYWLMEIAIRLRDASTSILADAYAQEVFGEHQSSWLRVRTPLRPAYYYRMYQGCLEVTIDGPSGAEGYARFVQAFEDTSPRTVNSHCSQESQLMFTEIMSQVPGDLQHILVHGHSQGSGIALALAMRFRHQFPQAKVRCVTYGGPKVLRGDARGEVVGMEINRWIVINDPVPLVPVSNATAAMAIAQVGLPGLREWSTWDHVGTVQVIDGSSTPTLLGQPAFDPNTVPAALASWLYLMATRQQSGHSQQTYSRYLEAVGRVQVQQTHSQGRINAPPASEVPRPEQMRQVVRDSVERMQQQEALQLQTPTEVPDVWKWRTEKAGSVWNTYWGPYLVCSSMRRKSAASVARYGNLWQKAIQRKPVVERAALVEAMVEYLTAASDPESGFLPTMAIAG